MGNWFTDGVRELGGSASDLWAGVTGGETRAQEQQRMRQQIAFVLADRRRVASPCRTGASSSATPCVGPA